MKEEKEIDTWNDQGKLICPYCGYEYEIDHTEDFGMMGLEFDDVEFTCPNCEEEYFVSQRVSFTHETFKKPKEEKKTDLCKTCEHYWKDFPMPCENVVSHCAILDEMPDRKPMNDVVPYPCLSCPFDSYSKKE